MATLLSVLQDACDFGGFPRPTSVINSADATTRQLLAIANERGIEAVRMFDWPQLTKLSSLTLIAGTNQTLPADCSELLDSTAWYTGDMSPLRGPITPQEWQYLTQTSSAGIKFAFRVTQSSKASRAVAMHPTPAGTETISLFYRSKTWIKPQDWVASMSVTAGMWVFSDGEYWTANTSGTAGTTAPTVANNGADGTITWTRKANVLYERFIADTDEPLIEPSLLMKGILARFYRMKGLEYQDLEAEFNIGLRNDLAERNGGRTSNMFRYNCGFIDTECRDVGFIGGPSTGTSGGSVSPTLPTQLSAYGIGWNMNGQLGKTSPSQIAVSLPISFVNEYAKVSAGERNTLFIKTNGTMWSCGRNVGAIGDGSFADITVTPPIQIGGNQTWKEIACGYQYALAIRQDNTLWAWGRIDNCYSLGDGTTSAQASPIQIGTGTNWSKVFAGERHSLAIKADGSLWAWGYNDYGALGDATTSAKTVPTQVITGGIFTTIGIGDRHTLGIKSDGTLWAWGYNNYGQLGDGTITNRTLPVQIGTGTNWKQVVAGYLHSVALKTDGTLWSWGYGGQSALGQGNTSNYTVPRQIGTDTDWSSLSISMGSTNTHHAIKSDGTLYGWGANNNGPIGDGSTTTRLSPVLVSAPTDIIHIANGYYHTMFLTDPGA